MAQGMNRPGANAAGQLGTVIIEAGQWIEDLARKLGWAMAGGRRHRVAVTCPRWAAARATARALAGGWRSPPAPETGLYSEARLGQDRLILPPATKKAEA